MEFLNAKLVEVCETVAPWDRPGTRVVRGHSYLYDLDKIRADAARVRLHLDTWLTHRVTLQFHKHHPRQAFLLFLSTGRAYDGRDFVRLTLSERSGILECEWLNEIPGFFDYGREGLPPNASLWASWNGAAFCRVHDFLDGQPSGLMTVDIGGMGGIAIFTNVSEDDYESIKNDPIERWDYSPIPRDFIEQIVDGADSVPLRHLAFRSIPPGASPDEVAEEDHDQPASRYPKAAALSAAEVDDMLARIGNRSTRASAIVEACERRANACIPAIVEAIEKLTWAEVDPVRKALPHLAPEIVQPLLDLLSSTRKQAAEIATVALARIGDPKVCFPLLEMMEHQAGTANAIRARDALIAMGEIVVPGLVAALDFDGWESRMYAAQALGAIGDSAALDRLREVAASDRSSKVRDAATEAIRSIEAEGNS